VRAAQRFFDDAVDDAESQEICARKPQMLGGFRRARRVAPQDRRAALRRGDRVDRVLRHDDAVGERDRKRSARTAFADNRRHDRNRRLRKGEQTGRNRLGLCVFLGCDAGIGSRRIDQGHDR